MLEVIIKYNKSEKKYDFDKKEYKDIKEYLDLKKEESEKQYLKNKSSKTTTISYHRPYYI